MTFNLVPYESKGFKLAILFKNLFVISDVKKPEYFPYLQFIKDCGQTNWPPPSLTHGTFEESDVLLAITEHILIPLCATNEIFLEKKHKYRDLIFQGVSTKLLGMGTTKTWHGTPDARVRGFNLVLPHNGDNNEDNGDSDSDSDGETTAIEAKTQMTPSNLPQTIATCVVSSFIDKSLHPGLSNLVPTILIDHMCFQICLYDCVEDVLLLSQKISLASNGVLSSKGMAALWMVINHRYIILDYRFV